MLTVADLWKIAKEVLRDDKRVSPRDIVAMAAFHCGGFEAHLYSQSESNDCFDKLLDCEHGRSRFVYDAGMFASYLGAFHTQFSPGQIKVLSGKVGFLPFRSSFFNYLISECGPEMLSTSDWWEFAKEIIDNPKKQVEFFARQLAPYMQGERDLAYTKYFASKAVQVSIRGRQIHELYRKARKPEEEVVLERIHR